MMAVAAVIVVLSLAPVPAAGQEASASTKSWTPPRTPDGQPDLQGMWLPPPGGQMETATGAPWRPGPNLGAFDFGAAAAARAERPAAPTQRERKPMVVDPPDGIIPLQPWAAAKREEIIKHQYDKVEYLDPRVRCLPSGVPRVNLPVNYNTYQFLQKPGYVVLLYEWNHLYRIIPLDGRPHVSPGVRLWMGDSRGHWEGNTLVVDVTNFTDKTWVVGHGAPPEGAPASSLTTGHGVFHSEALHVVERFTLADPDTITYEATIEDPKVFTKPWKIALQAFNRAPSNHMLFEYACHEGNRPNILLSTGVDIEATEAK